MGPAYFTKFLFFIGYHHPAHDLRPLILDKWVATALRQRGVFDQSCPERAGRHRSTSSTSRTATTKIQGNPEAVEIELFNEGGAVLNGAHQRPPSSIPTTAPATNVVPPLPRR